MRRQSRFLVSFLGNGKITCGESRGKVEVISLIECVDYVIYHLKSCHISRVKVAEYELILARAGNFQPSHDEITKLAVCPKHRHNLGIYWRPLRTCQYPVKTTLHCKNPVNWAMAQEIKDMFNTPVQVGSRK